MKKMSKNTVLKDLYENRNHSWFEEICNRNKNNLEKTAMLFRGTKISYKVFYALVLKYARSLKQYGINKGDEFVACLRQTPDYPILVAAASLIGAKINLVAADFDKDYLAQIINSADAKIVLVDDWDFSKMEYSLHKSTGDKKIVVLPVDRWNKNGNPYSEITDRFYKFDESEYKESISHFDNIVHVEKFLEDGYKYNGEINGHGKLQDVLAITYTSGSTKKGIHKGVPQRNETYIIMGRYHDHEVEGIPPMKDVVSLATVGPHADTTLMSGVSDILMQGGTVALDPIVHEDYFLYSLIINKARMPIATRTHWIKAMKMTYDLPEFKNLTLPYMYVPCEGGEPLSPGEEKALNRWLKDVKAGIYVTHTPVSVAKMTVGGGSSENGNIFLRLYRGYYNPMQKIRDIKEPMGLNCYSFAECEVLRPDGTYCNPMEIGRLVTRSPISMKEYHNDPEATKEFYIKDAYGKEWEDFANYGYKDKWNNVYIKGRIGNHDPIIKNFQVADVILRDTKNIMSCEVITIDDGTDIPIYIAHIELQFHTRVNIERTLISAEKRCESEFGELLRDRLVFRVRSYKEGFPTLFTAKRNITALKEEGITEKCIVPSKYYSQETGLTRIRKK